MFLVGVDTLSKWQEVRVMSTTTAVKTLDVLREHIVTDNGPQFISEEFEIFTKRNGIKHVKSASYHPASNGLAKRFIQSLKQSLKASVHDGRSPSPACLYLLSYRTTAYATTVVPPCKLFLQRELRTHLSLLQPDCERAVVDKQSLQKSTHDRHAWPRTWSIGDRVMVQNARPGPDWIPGTITELLGPVTYRPSRNRWQSMLKKTHQPNKRLDFSSTKKQWSFQCWNWPWCWRTSFPWGWCDWSPSESAH